MEIQIVYLAVIETIIGVHSIRREAYYVKLI